MVGSHLSAPNVRHSRGDGNGVRRLPTLDPAASGAFDRAGFRLVTERVFAMLTLFYGPGACSMASHIVLEESGEKYEPKRMDLAKGEQRSEEYLKMNPQGRVPLLKLDDGTPLAENTAILPYLGKRFK